MISKAILAVAIAGTTITLGRSLSPRLVAEGIEPTGQVQLPHEMGCDEFQGYFLARPLPAKDSEIDLTQPA